MRLFEHVVYVAQLTGSTGIGLRNAILNILGTFLVAIIAARALSQFADEKYGKMITMLFAGAVVAGICYFPDQAIGLLKSIWSAAVGSG